MGRARRDGGDGVRPAARGADLRERPGDHGGAVVLDATAGTVPVAQQHAPHHPEAVGELLPRELLPARPHAPASASRPAPAATPAGTARSYSTDGGRVVFELGADSAKLVSATPEPGWSMRVWTNSAWIRVNFAQDDGTTVSVFCTWNGHPPQVEIVK